MSVPAIRWAWQQKTVTPLAKYVLVALADSHNAKSGRCDPSHRILAEKTGLSERSVRRSLEELEVTGLIVRLRRWHDKGKKSAFVYELPACQSTESPASQATVLTGHCPVSHDKPDSQAGDTPYIEKPEVEPKPLAADATASKTARKQDLVWEALTALFGEPVTKDERGVLNRAAAQLRDAAVDPSLISETAKRYRDAWPGMSLTPQALTKHWSKFATANGNGRADLTAYPRLPEIA